jgi:hypothetical protein
MQLVDEDRSDAVRRDRRLRDRRERADASVREHVTGRAVSRRSTGRLGYDRPDSSYAIEGKAELALRYSYSN